MNIEQTEGFNTDNLLKMLEQYRSPGMVQVNKSDKSFENGFIGSSASDIASAGNVMMEPHLGKNVNLWA